MTGTLHIGLDIGGTRLTAGLVTSAGRLLAVLQRPTPADGGLALAELERMVSELLESGNGSPAALGISFGGPVDFAGQTIVRSHHVEGWPPGLALPAHFSQRFGLPALMDNDANCGGLGEALFGAGQGFASVLYVNIGTGIGGALVLDGRVHHGAHSSAGEIGHCVLSPGGPLCTCGKRGCLEAFSSGSALGREGRLAGLGETSTGREVGERAQAGDPVALSVVEQAGRWLGLALGNAANLWDADVIVLGGGVPELGDIFLQPVRAEFAATVMPAAAATPIVTAALGYEAGIVGAAALCADLTSA